MMVGDAYRLWQLWQQMHYPRRGLPQSGGGAAALLAVDGTAGVALERHFRRGRQQRPEDREWRPTVEACRRPLDELGGGLSDDAAHYFGRLRLLLDFVLAADGANDDRLGRSRHSDIVAG